MNQKTASNLRKIALIGLIVFDVLMLFCWWIAEQFVTFWMFIAINLCVFAAEVINSVWVYKKTVSTQMTKTLESQPKMRIWIYLGLLFFFIAMVSLILHWLIWAPVTSG